jgi:hypothetical protein
MWGILGPDTTDSKELNAVYKEFTLKFGKVIE